MIVYHKNNEIDREQWDNCIRNTPGAKPYGYSWYLDIMAPGWEALVDDDYDSVFPLPCQSLLGVQYISTPHFVQQLGAFSPDKPQDKAISEFLQYMPDIYRHIDLCVAQNVSVDGYKLTVRSNSELDLSKPYSKLKDSFAPHCLRTLESLQKKRIEISEDITPDELLDLHFINDRKGFHSIKPRDYQHLKNLMNFCIKNKKGRILGIRAPRKKLNFGLFMVETPGRKTLPFLVNSPEGISRKSAYAVVGHIISEFSSTKTILDFGGSSVPTLDEFMESFGCINTSFYRISLNKLFWPARIMK
jgi:hypothetical protein